MARAFADLARKHRQQARVYLADVAKALGTSVAYVSEIERGNRPAPSIERAELWAKVVKGDINEFIEAAVADRERVELELGEHTPGYQRRLAPLLARAWKDGLTAEQAEKIQKLIEG